MRRGLPGVRVTEARSPWQRVVGFIGRSRVGDDEGMLFERCSSIHTLFMRVPIDVVFLDTERRVVRTVTNVPPWRPIVACARAASVVELAAGSIERARITAGEVLEL